LGVTGPFLTQEQVITKTRYVEETRNHPLLRVDDDPPLTAFDWIIDLETPLVLVDYNKGFLKAEDMEKASLPALSFMDTKKPLGAWCRGVTFIKINEHECKASWDFIQANPWMDEKLIVTLGHRGASYMGKVYPVKESQVFDVTGAGDTFFAGFIASYLKSKDVRHAIMVANECARRVVMQRGTSVVSAEMRELL
jgi:sugar/nucleoside kinase (ribokinase family)